MSIRSIADRSGEAWADLAAWSPEDPADLFDLFALLAIMLHDVAYGIARAADRVSGTAMAREVTDMLNAAANAVWRAEEYATELERIARLLGALGPRHWPR